MDEDWHLKSYCISLKAVIFVVDCASPEKLPEAAEAAAEVMSIGALSREEIQLSFL